MRRALTPALVVLVAVLALVTWRVEQSLAAARAAAGDREAAMRAASGHAVSLMSLSHRTVDDDMRRVLATSTGQERAEYARNEADLKAAALRTKVVQTGVLRASALASFDAARRTAEVLVIGDAVVHWEDGKKAAPEERFFRWRMRVTEVSGQWLVATSERVQ
ncbi:hypothetical protein [Microbispora sp. NPDC049125]|uniref:hypothetical protein n=1 Tax=Microbispora sp. NPDC049125 TaxID=3154929 RepID=UPI0034664AC6